jgi:diaminopimelate epimerase
MLKMQKLNFQKIVGSGNDFLVAELNGKKNSWLKNLAVKVCNRKYGFGADGLLVLERTGKADIRMRIFNADGTEAEMCGNGARCTAFYMAQKRKARGTACVSILTRSGLVDSWVKGTEVGIRLTPPRGLRVNVPLKIESRVMHVNYIDTGVPHVVVFVEGLDKINVDYLGRLIRYHKEFAPRGTNVNFVEVQGRNAIRVRTYERGVEAETLACGTGSVASSLITACYSGLETACSITVEVASGEKLKCNFEMAGNGFKNVWLAGPVRFVGKGEYYV